jgi:hypothetical protein
MKFSEALEIGVTIDHPSNGGTYEIIGKHFGRTGEITLSARNSQ